jgi:hypothetical protein
MGDYGFISSIQKTPSETYKGAQLTFQFRYNKVNGTSMSENTKMLQGLLREHWVSKAL